MGRRGTAGLFATAAASAGAGLALDGGALGESLRIFLFVLGGLGAYLAPPFLAALAVALWRPAAIAEPYLARGRVAAWFALALGLQGLFQAADGDPVVDWDGRGGGLLGWLVLRVATLAFGGHGALATLFAICLAALLYALAIRPIEVAHALHRFLREVWRLFALAISSLRRPVAGDSEGGFRTALVRPRPDAAPSSEEAVERTPQLPIAADPPADDSRWQVPGLDLLTPGGPAGDMVQTDVETKAQAIEQALAEFDVHAEVVEVNPGPTVTQFGLRPGFRERKDRHGNVVRRDKIKVSEIIALQNDLALALAAPSIRIEAPVPGRQVVGLEVPNGTTGMVALRDLLQSPEFQKLRQKSKLAVALGRDVSGHAVAIDLARAPHLLIAGATGSGKSVCVNSIIASLLLQSTPDDLRLIMVDPKRVELTGYNGIPHLLREVVVDAEKVVSVLRWVTHEMDERYKRCEALGVRNIEGFNRRAIANGQPSLYYLVVVIDELADIMLMAAEEIEPALCRLAQMARAVGIHLVVATQRPSVDVITGLIKANFPTRISFAVTSQVDSRTILDAVGAEKLLGRGDMLYLASDAPKPARLQGTWVSDAEIEGIIEAWRAQGSPHFVEQLVNVGSWKDDEGEDDDLYSKALEVARQHSRVSTSLIQRRLRIGYPRAARLLELLSERGIVGPADGGRARDVLVRDEAPTPEVGDQ